VAYWERNTQPCLAGGAIDAMVSALSAKGVHVGMRGRVAIVTRG
jgi:hypothetical protein